MEYFFEKHVEYEIIHGHIRSTASIYLKIAKDFKLTRIMHSHSVSAGSGIIGLIKTLYQIPIRYLADYYFACSELAGKWLYGDKIIKSSRFTVLRNAINIEKFLFSQQIRNQVRKELGINKQYVIGHVGRFHDSKNHIFLVDIFHEISKIKKDVKLLLVGDGENRQKVMEKIDDLNLAEKVILTGVRNDVNRLMMAMDIFVFPSKYEGLGMVLIEAQYCGLKCVVSDIIPKEAFVSDNIESVDLSDDIEKWVNTIIAQEEKCNSNNRHEFLESNSFKSYSIEETSKFLENFYLKVDGTNEN